jgi:hypothetical protein
MFIDDRCGNKDGKAISLDISGPETISQYDSKSRICSFFWK